MEIDSSKTAHAGVCYLKKKEEKSRIYPCWSQAFLYILAAVCERVCVWRQSEWRGDSKCVIVDSLISEQDHLFSPLMQQSSSFLNMADQRCLPTGTTRVKS